MKAPPWQLALGVQAALSQAGWVGIRLMISYRALSEGAEPFQLGVIAASFAAPALIASLAVGRLADRYGGAKLSFSGIVIALLGTLSALLMPGLWLLTASSILIGCGHVCIMIGQQTLTAAQSHDTSPDAAFGNLTAAASIGQLIGPPAVAGAASIGLLHATTEGPNTSQGIIASGCFLVLAMSMFPFLKGTRSRKRPKTTEIPSGRLHLIRTPNLWRALVVSGAVLVTVDLLYAFIPAWAVSQGISVTTVGFLLAVRATVSVVSRIGLSRLVNTFGRRTLITISMLAGAAALCALPFVGTYGATVAMIGLGLGLGIPQPLTMSWVVRITDPSLHGAALGLRMSSNRLAQITLPIAVGAVAAPFGASGIFVANAALLVAAVFTLPNSGLDHSPQAS